VTFPASGDFNDGNKIHPQCTTNKNYVLGYVAGLHDRALNDGWAVRTFVSDTVTLKNSVVRMVHGFCVPEKVTLGQVSDVFCSYLAKNPKDRHKDASDLFSVAMIEAWPCP
jgi:hypothetical protein